MLSAIIVQDPQVRTSFVDVLSLEKFAEEGGEYTVYKRGKWILVFGENKKLTDITTWTLENYFPELLYLPFFGKSIDVVHEIGDVVLPNVFLSYNPEIEKEELHKENRDTFLSGARFLEIYNEQKDYYVEDYGLSVGGIVTDRVPESADPEKLMLAYEADIYIPGELDEAYQITMEDKVPTVIACGIISGKIPKNITCSPIDHTVKNMVATFGLLLDE